MVTDTPTKLARARPVKSSSMWVVFCVVCFVGLFGFILLECSQFVDLHEHKSSQIITEAIRMHESHISHNAEWHKSPHKNLDPKRGPHGQHLGDRPSTPAHLAQKDASFDMDWDLKFWTPIEMGQGKDPMVKMCQLDFEKYSSAPHTYGMFRELVKVSKCTGHKATKSARLSTVTKKVEEAGGDGAEGVLKPSGFVFHESRVGSTLVANAFGADPQNMVFSESPPPTVPLLHCHDCSREEQVQLFRDVITVMGMSRIHKRMFFKFQSATVLSMEIALEAFPDTPWTFVYRDPVQTMMSHLAPDKMHGGTPVCARGMHRPPHKVVAHLKEFDITAEDATVEQYCAAHLANLCSAANDAFDKYGTFEDGSPRGLLLDYAVMPGGIASLLVPHFRLDMSTINPNWLSNMERETGFYSKPMGHEKKFTGDVEKKEEGATPAIEEWAGKLLTPLYTEMAAKTEKSFRALVPADLQSKVFDHHKENKDEMYEPLRAFHPFKGGNNEAVKTNIERLGGLDHIRAHNKASRNMHNGSERSGSEHSGGDLSGMHPHSVIEEMVLIEQKENPFYNTHASKPFEMTECPLQPSEHYPIHYPSGDVLGNWNPDDTTIPAMHYDSLCHFDFSVAEDQLKAENYRRAEVPFIIYNHPDLDTTASKWSKPDYVQNMLGGKTYMTETSTNNHFMYWHKPNKNFAAKSEWKQPTGNEQESFTQWLEIAMKGQTSPREDTTFRYFRASSGNRTPWIDRDLPFFSKNKKDPIFMVKPDQSHGVHCRFGMKSVIAEAHWDGSRNMVAMIGGLRRWVLSHPKNCVDMYIYPNGHPSGRHSSVDWSQWDEEKFPDFANAQLNEVILQAGDFLYVPTDWIHYIVSLGVNYQCNCRSGTTKDLQPFVMKCKN